MGDSAGVADKVVSVIMMAIANGFQEKVAGEEAECFSSEIKVHAIIFCSSCW